MGEKVNHMNGQKYSKKAISAAQSASMSVFFPAKTDTVSSGNTSTSNDDSKPNNVINESSIRCAKCASIVQEPLCANCAPVSILQQPSEEKRGLSSMLQRDDVSKAEIIWCINSVINHHTSQRSGGESALLFPVMFHDSTIASKMQLQRNKIGYTINFGLSPYFHRELQDI